MKYSGSESHLMSMVWGERQAHDRSISYATTASAASAAFL